MSYPLKSSFAAAVLLLPLSAIVPPADGPVIVVVKPGTPPDVLAGIVAAADGVLLRGMPVSWAVVARSERTDFAVDLRRAGALVVLDASRIAGCFQNTKTR